MFTTVLLDVDGTLVDSNDAHARAWVSAFAEEGNPVDLAQVRRCIGMGGDKLIPQVSGLDPESPAGKRVGERRGDIFRTKSLPHLQRLPGADRLVAALKDRGYTLVVASSAKRDELSELLRIAGADWLLDGVTSSDDADASKPEPDIIHAALREAEAKAADAVMIGDTPYDIEAASRAQVAAIAFRTGGWSDADLSGAIAIYDGPDDLLAKLDESVLRGKRRFP